MPDDVREEVRVALDRLTTQQDSAHPFHLIVRRSRETMNSLGRRVPGLVREPYNPCYMHPEDLTEAGLESGSTVELTSDHGSVVAIVEPDKTLRRGVLAMTHCFGGEPGLEDDVHRFGTNPTRLLSLEQDAQPISLMPLMTAVPVSVAAKAI